LAVGFAAVVTAASVTVAAVTFVFFGERAASSRAKIMTTRKGVSF